MAEPRGAYPSLRQRLSKATWGGRDAHGGVAMDAKPTWLAGYDQARRQLLAAADDIENAQPKAGDRFDNGGQPGVLVRCPECSGDGTLHRPDQLPPAIAPTPDAPDARPDPGASS